MKNLYATFVFLALSQLAFTQASFLPGYIINNNGEKIECEIEFTDWKANPSEFRFKINGQGESIGTLEDFQEFGVDSLFTFRRFQVDMNRSNNTLSRLTQEREPVLQKEVQFLKLLVGGDVQLYGFIESNVTQFYIKNALDANPTTLIYKRFLNKRGKPSTNNYYISQLSKVLDCVGLKITDISKTEYEKFDLISLMSQYYSCKGGDNYVPILAKEKTKLVFSLRAGMGLHTLKIDEPDLNPALLFDSDLSFRYGGSMELIFPQNFGKWSVLIQPTYQSFKATTQYQSNTISVDYKALELQVGFRKYFIKDNKKVAYINALVVPAFGIGDNNAINFGPSKLTILGGTDISLGAGLLVSDKVKCELRYTGRRKIIDPLVLLTRYSSLALYLEVTF